MFWLLQLCPFHAFVTILVCISAPAHTDDNANLSPTYKDAD